jgi:hypothetical protein
MLIVTAIVATGAGLHVAAYFIEHRTVIGPLATVLSVATPVAAYIGLNYATYYYLVRRFYRLDVWLLTAIAAILRRERRCSAVGYRRGEVSCHSDPRAGNHRRWIRRPWIPLRSGGA